MIAASSGGAGDLVFSIQVMRKLGIKTIYVKESFYPEGEGSLYANIKPLLEVNGFQVLPTSGAVGMWDYEPGLRFDYDMDDFRQMPGRNRVNIIANQHYAYGLPEPKDYKKPWLQLGDRNQKWLSSDTKLFNVTNRWREGSTVNWAKVREQAGGKQWFIGLKIDHERFENEAGKILHLRTRDFLEMSEYINDCEALYCNQSVGLALAQSLGKRRFVEFKPNKTNVRFFTDNETAL